MLIPKSELIEQFSQELSSETGALFVGAGLSQGSGLVSWRELLREPARSLGIDIDDEDDLPQIAEYYVQEKGRGTLNQILVNKLQRRVAVTENHDLIAKLPVRDVWTTNFDDLLERSFADNNKQCDVKRRDDDFMVTTPESEVRIYKMHGDISSVAEVVITRSDYDEYSTKHRTMFHRFSSAIAESTLLFIGFGLQDPNFRAILGEHSSRFNNSLRQHFAVLLEPAGGDAERRLFELFVRDLHQRYNIQTVGIRKPSELTEVLKALIEQARQAPRVIFTQQKRNDFIVRSLGSIVRSLDEGAIEIYMSMVFSSFAISNDEEYRAGEPDQSDAHMEALIQERDLLLQLLHSRRARFKVLLCPPPYDPLYRVRYENVLRWLEQNEDVDVMDVRCTVFDYFQNMLIIRGHFCIVATFNPGLGYHENRVYKDRSIEHFVKHFLTLFERAKLARNKREAIECYRYILERNVLPREQQWTRRGQTQLHAWHDLALVCDEVAVSDEKRLDYTYVNHPGSVMVIPLLDGGKAVLVEQHRYLVGASSLEFPAGGSHPGETDAAAATRELEEEIGYRASRLTRLGSFYTSNALTNEVMTVFLATGLERIRAPMRGEDIDEIRLTILGLSQLADRIRNGDVTDGPTIASLQLLDVHQSRDRSING